MFCDLTQSPSARKPKICSYRNLSSPLQTSAGIIPHFFKKIKRDIDTRLFRDKIHTILRPKINNEITAPELRVIDDSGKNLGVMPREKALSLAKPEEGLDLIEISPAASPPVARIMSYDKYRYIKGKEEKKERRGQKGAELKQVQISVRAARNDLLIKARQAEDFLNEGHFVDIQMRMRGREKGKREWAEQKLREFLAMITVEFKELHPPKLGGRGLMMQIAKK